MRKIGRVILCIVPLIYALLIQVGVLIIGLFLVGAVHGMKLVLEGVTDSTVIEAAVTDVATPDIILTITAIAAVISMIVFGIWYKSRYAKGNTLSIKKSFTVKNIVFITILGLGLQVVTTMLLTMIIRIKPEWFESYMELIESLTAGGSIITFVFIVIIAPISEELIFRGVILEKCRKNMPLLVANVLQALLFGIYHMNLVQGTYAFVLGMFLGVACIRCKSIYIAIFLHMVINAGGLLIGSVFTENMLHMPFVIISMILISTIAIIYSMAKLPKLQDPRIAELAIGDEF